MIAVHRLTHPNDPLYLNPDLIQSIEAHPDTVISLCNASRFVVSETPAEVTAAIRAWRSSILVDALENANPGVGAVDAAARLLGAPLAHAGDVQGV